jgi:uncharacterized protein
MNIPDSYINGFYGGLLIGAAAGLLFWLNGRIMGVSGIVSRLLDKETKDSWWRLAFIIGLVLGGFIYQSLFFVVVKVSTSTPLLILAGLLVGFGTVWGNGCTSGHGICGIARLSKRSIVATLVFMTAGVMTVFLKRMWGL